MLPDRGPELAQLFGAVLTGQNGGIGSGQSFYAGKCQTAKRQKVHQPVMFFAPGTIQKLRGNAGHVMGPVGAIRHIRCAQLPQNPFCLCLDVLCRQGLAAQMFLTHQINKAIQHGGVAVYFIAAPDRIRVIVGDSLSPFFVVGRVAPIPILELDSVGQNQHHPVHAVGLDHALGSIVAEIHSIEVFTHRRFNSLLAFVICTKGSTVFLQLTMLFRIRYRMRIERDHIALLLRNFGIIRGTHGCSYQFAIDLCKHLRHLEVLTELFEKLRFKCCKIVLTHTNHQKCTSHHIINTARIIS